MIFRQVLELWGASVSVISKQIYSCDVDNDNLHISAPVFQIWSIMSTEEVAQIH